MAWLILLLAGAVEIVMASALKAADGWSRPLPSAIGIGAALASIFLLAHAMKALPAGTAYAVWTGIGAVGVTLMGMVVHGDSASPVRLRRDACILHGTDYRHRGRNLARMGLEGLSVSEITRLVDTGAAEYPFDQPAFPKRVS